ncbi:MAG: LysE family translocator [Pelagibacteraceae bacterium]
MFPENYLIFLQIILFMFITPGAPRVLIMSQSLNYGFGRSLWTAFGDVSANTLQGVLVLLGFGAVVKLFPDIVIYFKWAGILYLLYIAYGYVKNKSNIDLSTNLKIKSTLSLYIDGFLVAFFSPKATIFFVTIFPTFLKADGNYLIQFFILMSSYVILDFLTLAIYSGVAKTISNKLKANLNTLNYISSGALVLIAIIIAVKV